VKTYTTNDRLVQFLYLLLRDYLPAGQVESIMAMHVEKAKGASVLSNEYTAQHAEDIAARIYEGNAQAVLATHMSIKRSDIINDLRPIDPAPGSVEE
jgi:hypothetical protein